MGTIPATSNVELRVLGPMEVSVGAGAVRPSRPTVRALLAFLLLQEGRVASTDRVLGELWPDSDPSLARRSLWVQVANLRQILEPHRQPGEAPSILVNEGEGYRLEIHPERVDMHVFQRFVNKGLSEVGSNPGAARDAFEAARALWRGPLFVDVPDAHFARPDVERIAELRLRAEEGRLQTMMSSRDSHLVAGEVRRLIDDHPFRESLWALEMKALYREGQQADALRRYQTLRGTLRSELGIDPSPELQRLEERILLHDESLEEMRVSATRSNLSARTSTIVGRDSHVGQVRDLLSSYRVVTLTGPGGVGKTSLAVEAVRSLDPPLPDEVWFVDFGSIGDGDLVVRSMAAVIGVDDDAAAEDIDRVADFLAAKGTVLVLDNCEHLLSALAPVVQRLVGSVEKVRVLATSREPLGVAGEVTWTVPPLPIPDAGASLEQAAGVESVRLFASRARERDRTFTVAERNIADVVDICRRLDGMPLAIELAAAQSGVLGIEAVGDRLSVEFEVLESSLRSPAERHSSALASVLWSYRLLTSAEQSVFDRLSVFAGVFRLADAEGVAALPPIDRTDFASAFKGLVDKSMVQVAGDDEDGRRFRVLEIMRSLGRQHLSDSGEADRLRESHASYFLERAGSLASRMRTGDRSRALELVESNYEDFRGAAVWCLENEGASKALGYLGALGPFWGEKSAYAMEGTRLAWRMIEALDGERPPQSARALVRVGYELRSRGELDEAARIADEAIVAADGFQHDVGLLVDALNLRGVVALVRDEDESIAYLERSLHLSEQEGDLFGSAHARLYLGFSEGEAGRWGVARTHLEAARAIFETCGGGRPLAGALGYLGRCAFMTGDTSLAATLTERSIEVGQMSGAHHENAYGFNALAVVHLSNDDLLSASLSLEKSLAVSGGNSQQLSTSTALAGVVLARVGRFEEAAELLDCASSMRQRHGFVEISGFSRSVISAAQQEIDGDLDAELLLAARVRGQSIPEESVRAAVEGHLRSLSWD